MGSNYGNGNGYPVYQHPQHPQQIPVSPDQISYQPTPQQQQFLQQTLSNSNASAQFRIMQQQQQQQQFQQNPNMRSHPNIPPQPLQYSQSLPNIPQQPQQPQQSFRPQSYHTIIHQTPTPSPTPPYLQSLSNSTVSSRSQSAASTLLDESIDYTTSSPYSNPSPVSPKRQIPNLETLEEMRVQAKRSDDPMVQFEFAKYLIAVAEESPDHLSPDPKKSKKLQKALYDESLKLLKRLASGSLGRASFPEAQFFLAEAHGNGSYGLEIDHARAFGYYSQASKQSHPTSTYRTAVCYEMGAGTKKDAHRAAQFYRKAAASGHPGAMYKFGMVLVNGLLNQQRNPREGISWLKRASTNETEPCPYAFHELGCLYEGTREDIPRNVLIADLNYAYELFLKAANMGYAPSQYKLGLCYEYGLLNLPIDARRSISWYTKAAEQGDPEAELALSGWYLTGSEGILKQSDTEAYLWARRAADKGLAKAEYAVGYYSENGVGVKMDAMEAQRWYLRAAGQGNKRALNRLKEIKQGINMPHPNGFGNRASMRALNRQQVMYTGPDGEAIFDSPMYNNNNGYESGMMMMNGAPPNKISRKQSSSSGGGCCIM